MTTEIKGLISEINNLQTKLASKRKQCLHKNQVIRGDKCRADCGDCGQFLWEIVVPFDGFDGNELKSKTLESTINRK